MSQDVDGLYAILGLDPSASHEAIGAAFRRKAKELHPDVAGTGNAHAFISLRRAYGVLSNPAARAAYDHNSQQASKWPVQHDHVTARPPNADRNAKAWSLAFAAVLLLSAGSAIWFECLQVNADAGFSALPNKKGPTPSKQTDGLSARIKRTLSGVSGPSIASAAFSKSQMYYVLAAEAPLPVWHKALQGKYVQDDSIEPFTNIKLLQSSPTDNLAEVRFADGRSGYMDPRNIGRGDA